jgi:hypothetical protein
MEQIQTKTLLTINDRIKDKYSNVFEDQDRIPTFDEKLKMWEVSAKFNIDENDDPEFGENPGHPFLHKML